ncbi:MBL fold metallo-hydrolase [uncultured Cocleimonas sp.]|uniref:MBL fold metallo-hydrolase n=1 Tax=uncultured Cocleimonas sp. TaxID=1051587 RepID=UPI002606B931|nr:MBL fold metallo-hydrolase [uncultured Cocleimonas sp.]
MREIFIFRKIKYTNTKIQTLNLIISSLLISTLSVTSGYAANSDTTENPGTLAIAAANKSITNIDTATLEKLLKENPKIEMVDVRSANEIDFIGGYIDADETVNITRGWLEFDIGSHVKTKDTPIVVYCGTNQRSPLAAKTLMEMGYTNVKNYADGYNKWKELGKPIKPIDKAPESLLFSLPEKVTDNIYSAIGATAPGTYANSGHNNNLSFIITSKGVIVFNAGDNYLLAKALHHEIKKLTDKPIKYVILENAQGHAMLGSNYWKQQGAEIIAHVDAVEEMKSHGQATIERMQTGRRDKAQWTVFSLPDKTFEDKLVIELGGETFEILHLGPGHSPGDISLWIPDQKVLISGDMAFHQRLMPIFEHTDTAGWIETWDKIEALNADIIIPGHGSPTNISEVTKYTKDYLVYMRSEVEKILDDDGSEQDAYNIDQSRFSHLDTFNELALQNAGRIFRQMEFE